MNESDYPYSFSRLKLTGYGYKEERLGIMAMAAVTVIVLLGSTVSGFNTESDNWYPNGLGIHFPRCFTPFGWVQIGPGYGHNSTQHRAGPSRRRELL